MVTKIAETYKLKRNTKKSKMNEETEEEEDAPDLLVFHVNNILYSFFPMLKCTTTVSKLTIQMDSMRTKFISPITS